MLKQLKCLLTKPSLHHHSFIHPLCDETVPDTFSILCWNVHKNNDRFAFKHYIETFSEKKPVDFLLLQEADFRHNTALNLTHISSYHAAANLQKNTTFYGVLTASRCKTIQAIPFHSQGKELLLGPRKSLLLTRHAFEDGSSLLILNIHAINFRENRHYHKEIEQITHIINTYQGALIVAGDFNSWNRHRMQLLHKKMTHLHLMAVPFSQNDSVKSFMKNHLDFIFYRGVELLEYSTENNHQLSDHHPLFAKFVHKTK